MATKKAPEPPQPPEDEALEKRVDAMMDLEQPDAPSGVSIKVRTGTPPPIDIFKDQPGAPPLLDDSTTSPSKIKPPSRPAPQGPYKPVPFKPTAKAIPDTSLDEPNTASIAPNEPEETATAETPPVTESTVAEMPDTGIKLDEKTTEQAVDDIASKEGDALLAAEDKSRAAAVPKVTSQPGWKDELVRFFKNKWTWAFVGVIIVLLFAVPLTRYRLLGLVIKEPLKVQVTDSQTNTPVSNAQVSIGGSELKTNAAGQVTLKAPLGKRTLQVSEQYYKTYRKSLTIGFHASNASVLLVATGRQVPITVTNTISGKPLAGVEIRVLKTSAKTNASGKATIVLPATAASDTASVQLNGYNTAQVNVKVTNIPSGSNQFQLTPSGHVYFLSKASGTIDVVKANLDGSGQKTVFTGSGNEDSRSTSLLASRDWRYLVLKAQHDSKQASLYLIDTSNDKVTPFDNSNANFSLIGWDGHDFIYDLVSNTLNPGQAGHEVIKSYDADHLQLNQLDQNQVSGDAASYGYQSFANFYVVSGQLLYTTQWNSQGNYDLSGKSDTIRGIQPGGQSKKDYQSLPASDISSISATLYSPQSIYYSMHDSSTNTTTFYNFFKNSANADSSIVQANVDMSYPTYLLSPSGSQIFWLETRAGQKGLEVQNGLFVGSYSNGDGKQITSLTSYTPYGWYTNNYVLVSKSSQLFIMPSSGLSAGRQPLKITDYYKPAQIYPNQGYSYGGL